MTLRIAKPIWKQHPVYALDVETDEHGRFVFGCISEPHRALFFYNKHELSDYLKAPKPYGSFLVGMNIAYDLNSLLPDFNIQRFEHTGRFITCDYDKQIINNEECDYKDKKYKSNYFTIVDLGNFIQGMGLKAIAKAYEVPYIDIHDYHNPKIKEACFSHAEAARLVLDRIQKFVIAHGGELKLTAASTALDVFKRTYLSYDCQIFDNNHSKEELEIMRRLTKLAYHGAATECFRKGKFTNAIMLDVNSMYPSVMLLPMPDMNHYTIYDPTSPEWIERFNSRRIFKNREGCALVKIQVPKTLIPVFLPSKKDGKTVFKTGEFIGAYTFIELDYAIELGAKIIDVFWVVETKRMEGLFNDYVNAFYKLKQKKDTKQTSKLFLNSLYGKTGQYNRPESVYEVLDDGDIIDWDNNFEYEGLKFNYVNSDDEGSFAKHSYPLIAAYVTAYARIKLHKTMALIGFANVLYCDTDSIVLINRSISDLRNLLEIDDNNLGAWSVKWEGEIEIRAAKYYRYRTAKKRYWSYVTKGVSERYKADFWKDEDCYIMRPRKFRTALRTRKPVNEWIAMRYVRGEIKDKRRFLRCGRSLPFGSC